MSKKISPEQLKLDLESPTFVTWKKYGFRHIVEHEETLLGDANYINERIPTQDTSGKSICGSTYWWTVYPSDKDPWRTNRHDRRDKRRPLCGLCRKKWKALTGQEID